MNIFYKPIDVNASKVSLDEAIMYCTFLDHKGMKVWRLPTPDEVFEIYEHRKEKRGGNYIYHPSKVWNTDDLVLTSNPYHRARILAVRSKHAKESKV